MSFLTLIVPFYPDTFGKPQIGCPDNCRYSVHVGFKKKINMELIAL